MKIDPNKFSDRIRALFGWYPDYSLGCYWYARLMCEIYDGQLYYNGDHCVCRIGDQFHDLSGSTHWREGLIVGMTMGRLVEIPATDFLHYSVWGREYFVKTFGGWKL